MHNPCNNCVMSGCCGDCPEKARYYKEMVSRAKEVGWDVVLDPESVDPDIEGGQLDDPVARSGLGLTSEETLELGSCIRGMIHGLSDEKFKEFNHK